MSRSRPALVNESGGAPSPAPLEADFAAFFAASLDLLVIRDSRFRIVKVNPAWETVLGYKVEELEGQPMLAFIHPEDLAATEAQMRRVATDADVRGFVNRYRHRDGGYRYFEWRAHREGELVYGAARDVTDRIAIEAEMAAARAAAETANEAKSEFLANMSHEIRTPLNGVIGVAAALSLTELSPQQREMVDLILTSGETLERVVSDVLDFSKIEAGRLELVIQPFDLRAALDGLLDIHRLRAREKKLGFRVDYGPGAQGWFESDAVRLKQVLGNLVSNAIKFTTQGEVRVGIDVREAEGQAGGLVLALEVSDTGIGFDEGFARKVFQRFSQADGSITRRFGGTGLGLSICQALVAMLGGEIRANSAPGRGSTFEVDIPLAGRIEAAAPPPALPEVLPPFEDELEAAEPIRVLLAEDHEVNQRVVELILQPFGVELTKVADGAAALDAYIAGSFALVLMDMQMPVMDGLAATQAIREFEARTPERGRTPIIMLSANAMRQHGEEAIAAGADLHLAKPITPASLMAAVTRALSATAALAEPAA